MPCTFVILLVSPNFIMPSVSVMRWNLKKKTSLRFGWFVNVLLIRFPHDSDCMTNLNDSN